MKNNGELPQSAKRNRLPGNPGSTEKHTPRHIIITLAETKDKEKILKAEREKETVTYTGVPIRLSVDFSKEKETLQATKGWKEVFEVMKSKDLQPR